MIQPWQGRIAAGNRDRDVTATIAEVRDALRDAGAPDEKARRAAEVLASGDALLVA